MVKTFDFLILENWRSSGFSCTTERHRGGTELRRGAFL